MYNAYYMSDGAAMRSGPIGIVCAGDPERAAELAYRDACVSHYREGIWGAQAVAVAVSLAMVDADMEEIMEAILNLLLRIVGFVKLKQSIKYCKRGRWKYSRCMDAFA